MADNLGADPAATPTAGELLTDPSLGADPGFDPADMGDGDGEKGPVPYERFAQVNEARKVEATQNAALKEQIASLQSGDRPTVTPEGDPLTVSMPNPPAITTQFSLSGVLPYHFSPIFR